jgi:probable HAF family extracellular repeat protein
MSGYIYTTIPGPDGDDSIGQISAINDSGTVAAFFGNGTVSGEYIYSDGVYTTLTGPDGSGATSPVAVNDSGEVIGEYDPGGSPHAFIYQNGTYTTLAGPPDSGAEQTTADAINNAGTIAGTYYTGTNTYGFIYSNGTYTALTGPAGDNDADVLPSAINSSGEIVGSINPTTAITEGFIYNNGTYTLLTGPDLNDTNVLATAINDSGDVIISYDDGNGNPQSAVYDNNAYTTFSGPEPATDTGVGLSAISNTGEVFGNYDDGNGNLIAFVYNDGTYTTLSGPINGDSQVSVLAVNASGEIAGVAVDNGVRTAFTATLCFLRGTRILTPTGELPVEALNIGDRVVTRFGGVQKIKWIGRQSYDSRFIKENRETLPVCIHPGAFGDDGPERKLFLSPGHSLLIGGTLVLASALVNGVTVTQRYDEHIPAMIDYFQIELAAHDCIIAEGVWAETYADAPGLRAQFHNEAEYHALYPEEPPAEDLRLCAPRPERGEQRMAALRQAAALAEAYVTPGSFEGWIDRVSDWRIEGWAIDHDHPELPLMLEVWAGGEVIGTTLACEEREDLVKAGIGNGRRAFVFTPAARLRPAIWPDLKMRCVRDGAPLHMTPACRDRIRPAVPQAAE